MRNSMITKKMLAGLVPDELIEQADEVKIQSLASLFDCRPEIYTYDYCDGNRRKGEELVLAAINGRWVELDVGERAEYAAQHVSDVERAVPTIGEQLAEITTGRIDLVCLLEVEKDFGADPIYTLIVGVGPDNVRRYLRWRINKAAQELIEALG